MESSIPDRPAVLVGEAATEWDRITALLFDAGMINDLDRAALTAYCLSWKRWLDAEAEVAAAGEVVKAPSGYPIQNPWRAVANQAHKQMVALLGDLGLSPAARTRVLMAPRKKTEEKNPWSGLLAGVNRDN